MPGVLFLVDNVPFELDTRVQRETQTLMGAGLATGVICPGDRGQRRHEVVGGVDVYRYRKPTLGPGVLAHLAEYVTTLACQTVLTALAMIRHRYDVVHLANPPDLLWLVAAPYKRLGK